MNSKHLKTFSIFAIIFLTGFLSLTAVDSESNTLEEPQLNKTSLPKDPFTILQFSFFSPLQISPKEKCVYGLRLTLPYGENKNLAGLDIGIANQLDNLYGVSVAALLSERTKNMYGINLKIHGQLLLEVWVVQ